MRECRTYGSVRGALGNGRPYRDHDVAMCHHHIINAGMLSGRGYTTARVNGMSIR